jgi:hypothetical protein
VQNSASPPTGPKSNFRYFFLLFQAFGGMAAPGKRYRQTISSMALELVITGGIQNTSLRELIRNPKNS